MSIETGKAESESAAGPVRKFLFERSFDDPFAEAPDEPPKPPLLYTEDDLQAAVAKGRAQGFEEGRAAARDDDMARQESALQAMGEKIESFMGASAEDFQEQRAYIEEVAVLVARKILPAFIAREGVEEIATLVKKTVAGLAREPRLVIRISESAFDQMKARIDAIMAETAYPGQVVVLSDPSFAEADVRIEWADGGIERDLKKTWDEISRIVEANASPLPDLALDSAVASAPDSASPDLSSESPQTGDES